MKLWSALLFFAICISYWTEHVHGKTCTEFLEIASEKQIKSFFVCKKESGYKTLEEKVEKMACILKCTLQREGFLTSDGYVDEASALDYLTKEVPEDVQGKAVQLMAPCQALTDVDPNEATCASYKPLIKCAMMVVFKICG